MTTPAHYRTRHGFYDIDMGVKPPAYRAAAAQISPHAAQPGEPPPAPPVRRYRDPRRPRPAIPYQQLRAARIAQGLTQQRLAARIGCGERSLRLWESGTAQPGRHYYTQWRETLSCCPDRQPGA